MKQARESPFDVLASDYDQVFTEHPVGRLMREAVWLQLDRAFRTGDRILELNGGTGVDAVHLAQRGVSVLCTDASSGMLATASSNVRRCGVEDRVQLRRLAWEGLDDLTDSPFDGFLSNFGGLNCVRDIAASVPALARALRPGALGFVCIMGPYCVWEWLWYLAHADTRTAFRRLTRGGVEWRGIRVYYPTIRQLRSDFSSHFRIMRVAALGALLPPPFASKLTSRFPRATTLLSNWERRLETVPPLPSMADHYLLTLKRV